MLGSLYCDRGDTACDTGAVPRRARICGQRTRLKQLDMLRRMGLLDDPGGAAYLGGAQSFGGTCWSATESFVYVRSMEIAVTLLLQLVMVLCSLSGGDAVGVVCSDSVVTRYKD